MLALIDVDIVCHRVGFTTENDAFGIAKARCDETLDGILIDTASTEYRLYLSDSTANNFRTQFYPEYKANRTAPKPRHYDAIKEYLITEWGAAITMEQEADDALGIDQCAIQFPEDSDPDRPYRHKSVICSIDKDLLQIPGLHWNFVKKEWKEISEEEGLKRFYHQLIMGDASDNIKGVKGIGEVKAARILSGMSKESALFKATIQAYENWLKEEWTPQGQTVLSGLDEFQTRQMYNIILTTGRALKIRQEEGEIWQFPKEFSKLEPSLAQA